MAIAETAFPKTQRSWRRLRQNWHLYRASVHANRLMDSFVSAQDAGATIPVAVWEHLRDLARVVQDA